MKLSRIQELFEAAGELEADEWEDFLAQATDDLELRISVLQLLECGSRSPEFLQNPTVGSGEYSVRDASRNGFVAGAVVGGFTLVKRLGAGGGGVVFLARQDEPLPREVALKILRDTLDDAELRWRFDVERQAISRMNHPGIARVLDAGLTTDGRPWLAMELVPGEPICGWCDGKRLTLERRALLVAEVCEAVHHAHQKGVIHRDLKPGNILVAEDEAGDSRSWVIDFGIARLTDGDATRTLMGRRPGTPGYMSPEQVVGDWEGIDARTDIFSLGVILYELLTGRSAFGKSREMVTMGRLGSLLDAREVAEIADQCGLSASAWRRAAKGDLGMIAMKCVREDPAERYQSALGLAADLRAFAAGRPVNARGRSTAYVAGRFLRRHPWGAVAGAAAVALLAAAGIFTWIAERQALADQRRAEDLVAGFSRLIMQGNPEYGRPRDYLLRDAVIDFSHDLPSELRSDPLTEARARHTLGAALLGMGERHLARREIARAMELAEDLPAATTDDWLPLLQFNAGVEMKDRIAARRIFTKVERTADSELRVRALCQISMIDADAGRLQEAASRAQTAVALAETLGEGELLARTLWTLARTEKMRGRLADARTLQARRLGILEKSAAANLPVTWEARADLATLDLAGPSRNEAVAVLAEISGKMVRHFGATHPAALVMRIEYARGLAAVGRPWDAAEVYGGVLALAEGNCDSDDVERWQAEFEALPGR